MKDSTTAIFTSLSAALESRHFLATLGMEKDEMTAWIRRSRLRSLAGPAAMASLAVSALCLGTATDWLAERA